MKKRMMLLIAAILFFANIQVNTVAVSASELTEGAGTASVISAPEGEAGISGSENTASLETEDEKASEEALSIPSEEDILDADSASEPEDSSGPGKTVSLDLKEEVFHLGGLGKEPDMTVYDGALENDGKRKEFAGLLHEAMSSLKGSLDISEYGAGAGAVRQTVIDVLNSDPGLFNVTGVRVKSDRSDGTVLSVIFSYADGAKDRSSEYDEAVDRILSGIKRSWTDEAKLLYLHDYLVTHCQYDLTYTRYSAYNAIVEHLAVCQGYAEAYEDLVNKAGLSAYLVSSHANNHAWNLVKLNGKKYYVDCTWDDPITGDDHFYKMYCGHANALCSQSRMKDNGHRGSDWQSNGEAIFGKYDYKEYDGKTWKKSISSPFAILDDGYIIYIGYTPQYGCVMRGYDPKNGGESVFDAVPDGYNGEFSYFLDNTVACVKGKVYVNNSTHIYRFDPSSGKLFFRYSLSSSERRKGRIYGIEGEGSKLRYDIATGSCESELVTSKYMKTTGPKVNSFSLDRTRVELDETGDTVELFATVSPAGEPVRWGSSDDSIATVNGGLVTARGCGEAVIYANAGEKNAECTVYIGTILKFNKDDLTLLTGGTEKLTVTVINPSEEGRKSLWWYSSDPSIATVDQEGNVTGVSAGKTWIGVSGFGTFGFCDVTVKGPEPDRPVINSVDNTSKGIKVSWDSCDGATGYYVSRKDPGSNHFDVIATVKGTRYSDTGATANGKKYTYRIRAYRTYEGKRYKSTSSAATSLYRLSQTKVKSVSNKSGKKLKVTWKKNSKCDGYEIEYGIGGNFKQARTVNIKSKTTVSCTIKGLKKNKTYHVRVRPYKRAKAGKQYGKWSTYSGGVKIRR